METVERRSEAAATVVRGARGFDLRLEVYWVPPQSRVDGELFRGGICAQRNGCDLELTPAFLNFLNTKWMQFAADVVDSFLKFGVRIVCRKE